MEKHVICGIHDIPVTETLDPEGDEVGLHHFGKGSRIEIMPGLSKRALLQTVFHEVLHHVDEAYGLELGESGVLTLQQVLLGLVKDNPEWALGVVEEFSEAG